MFIRFRAEHYKVNGKDFVDVYDHDSKKTITFSLAQYRRIEKYLSWNGGIIYGEKEEDDGKKKARHGQEETQG